MDISCKNEFQNKIKNKKMNARTNKRGKEQKKRGKKWESWFVLCDVTELHLWRACFLLPSWSLNPNTHHHPAQKRGHTTAEDLARSGMIRCGKAGRGRRGGADWTSWTPFPPLTSSSQSCIHTHTRTHKHSHLMWILWACGSSVFLCVIGLYGLASMTVTMRWPMRHVMKYANS